MVARVISNDLIHINGYKIYRADRVGSGRSNKGGGLCVYRKEKFEAKTVVVEDYSSRDIEMLCIKFSGPKTGSIVCTTIYRPPKGEVDSALSGLNKLCDKLRELKYKIVVTRFILMLTI